MTITQPCKFCPEPKPMVSMDKDPVTNKWIVKNMDGSPHKGNHKAGQQQTPAQETFTKLVQSQPPPQTWTEAKNQFAQRDADIKQAHKDNMEASEALTTAVNNQGVAIMNLATAINALFEPLRVMAEQLKRYNDREDRRSEPISLD